LPADAAAQLHRRVDAALPSLSTAGRSVIVTAVAVTVGVVGAAGVGMALGLGGLDVTVLLVVLLLGLVTGLLAGVARLTSRVVRDVPEAVRVGVEVVPALVAHQRRPSASADGAAREDPASPVGVSDVMHTLLYAEVWAHVSARIRERVPVGAWFVERASRRAFAATSYQVTRDVRRRRARRRLVQTVLYTGGPDAPVDPGVEWITPEAVREALDAGRLTAHRQSRRIRWATAAILLALAALPTAWLAMTHT
jgi:hypothetical protein